MRDSGGAQEAARASAPVTGEQVCQGSRAQRRQAACEFTFPSGHAERHSVRQMYVCRSGREYR